MAARCINSGSSALVAAAKEDEGWRQHCRADFRRSVAVGTGRSGLRRKLWRGYLALPGPQPVEFAQQALPHIEELFEA